MKLKNNKSGITLVALILTIVILIILAVVAINAVSDNGIIGKAKETMQNSASAELQDRIDLAISEWKIISAVNGATEQEFKNILIRKFGENNVVDSNGNKDGTEMPFKVTYNNSDVYVDYDGIVMCLDIANGCIDLYSNGYKQYTGSMQGISSTGVNGYNGKYIITGSTTENIVSVCDIGDYDITIKDLNIDVSAKSNTCAFNCNRGGKATGLNVTINIEGENKLYGGSSADAISFAKATPNVDGVTDGSTLKIQGDGSLTAIGGAWGAGIKITANGTINSGIIYAKSGTNACAIGAGWREETNNIIINGGNITAISTNRYGIGAIEAVDNIIINGGNITAIGGEYGGAIGGSTGNNITINGGNIIATTRFSYPAIGFSSNSNTLGGKIEINGGRITAISSNGATSGNYYGKYAIHSTNGDISINGGTIFALGKLGVIGKYSSETADLEETAPVTSNVQLKEYIIPTGNKRVIITKVMIGDEVLYDTSMRTLCTREDGKIDIYVPTGDTRVITVEANGQTYTIQ